jgi:hypothetical protein
VALLGLATAEKIEVTENSVGVESGELEAIRKHLEPLELAPHGTPLPELARLAVLAITEK